MKFKAIIAAALLLTAWSGLSAQEVVHATDSVVVFSDSTAIVAAPQDLWTDEYLDTVNVRKRFIVNDYDIIGVEAGVQFCGVSFNPSRPSKFIFAAPTYGITYTHYCKMMGFMPYFGISVGVFHGYSGYAYKVNKDTGKTPIRDTITYESGAIMERIEVPLLSSFHFDTRHFKIMADVGLFGGYRYNIRRSGEYVDYNERSSARKNKFLDFENRWDYGIKAGLGFGLVFGPVEFHIKGTFKYSWSSLYKPNYYNQYYYRFAYPMDIGVVGGLYFHLTKRTGKTRAELRKEAKNALLINENPFQEIPTGEDR
ncbi:MAG: outer membrane beta-barrel protein [Bacteroidales bacterium]|nr:outer membrane beta-barrel protein [Bacteroidales bacterium]